LLKTITPLNRHTLKTFITSSPGWLITFTAIRPELGLPEALH
jgi:hypothetical protein